MFWSSDSTFWKASYVRLQLMYAALTVGVNSGTLLFPEVATHNSSGKLA